VTPDTASFQFLPTVATNGAGLVGLLFGDTRGFSPADARFHMYFAASVDGGATFLPARRLTSRPSAIATAAHARPLVNHAWPYPDSVSVWVWSVQQKHPTGGDYLGLAADVAGAFHALWADSRSGVYQAYTARIAVLPESLAARFGAGPLELRAVSNGVVVEFDAIVFDSATRIATMPTRLRNLSGDTVWGPVTVSVRGIGYRGARLDSSARWIVLNAPNGLAGVGAAFDFTPALGDRGYLPPGGVSAAVEWRARFPALDRRQVRLQLDVTGRVRPRAPGP
jgi:hypothetical protein